MRALAVPAVVPAVAPALVPALVSALASAAVLVVLAGPAVPASASEPHATEVTRFWDPAIVEASALVVRDGLYLTTNDSGDTGRVFAADASGRTVGVTHWSDDPVDVEALAPAGPDAVWVGDIGDDLGHRSFVTVTRVPVGRGDRTVRPTSYRLAYPGGARDAETLVRNPVTGRLYVASKDLLGGTLYAVPRHLRPDRVNRLVPVGRVLPLATDGAFFPDGRHLVVRGYVTATVYEWPSLRRVASFALPAQRQGEGIAIGADGEVYLSSEGRRSAVLRMPLPAGVRRALAPASRPPSPSSPSAAPSSSTAPSTGDPAGSTPLWPWLLGGVVGLGAVAVLLRSLRPH